MAFSYFFRDVQTLEIIRDYIIPTLKDRKYVRIWDAGCARGVEPYSLAILLRESMGRMVFRNIHIHATDIDIMNQFGDQIRSGFFKHEDVVRVPKDILRDNFNCDNLNGEYRVKPELRNRMNFERHDLLSLIPPRKDFSIILCKNVLLHFKHRERVQVINMFYNALGENGYFATEQTQQLPQEVEHKFEQIVPHAKVYRKVPSNREGKRSITIKWAKNTKEETRE